MKPDLIIVPNCGVNREVTDINSAYAAAVWDIPVLDLNSTGAAFTPDMTGDAHAIAISTRTFAKTEAARLADEIMSSCENITVGSLRGPIDVMCCYRYEYSEPVFSPDLVYSDDLPLPAYERFDSFAFLKASWRSGSRRYPLMTSLGCPYGCRFCMARKRGWHPRSPEHCLSELWLAVDKWGISGFQIMDDCFNFDEGRLLEFCRLVGERDIAWECNNGLRADRFSKAQAEALLRAGCRHVTFGVETIHDHLLNDIGKGETFAQIEQAIQYAKEAGLPTAGFFLIGLPNSSRESDMATVEWAMNAGIECHFSFFVPPEHWHDGNTQFWGENAEPLSDAYPAEEQREVAQAAARTSGKIRDRYGLVRNSAMLGLHRFASLVAFLVLVPVLTSALSKVGFAVYVLGKLVIQLANLVVPDFGVAMQYFLPRYAAEDNVAGQQSVIRTAGMYAGFLAVLTTLGAMAFLPLTKQLWGIDADTESIGVWTAYWCALAAGFSLFGRLCQGILAGCQRLDLVAGAGTVSTVLGASALGIGATAFGLVSIGPMLAAHAAFECTLLAAITYRLLAKRGLLASAGRGTSPSISRDLRAFTLTRWLTRFEEAGVPAIDKILVTSFCALPLLGLYHIANGVTTFLRDLPSMVSQTMTPYIAHLGHSSEPSDREDLAYVYDVVNRGIFLTKIGVFCFLVVNAHQILAAWLGGEIDSRLVLAVQLLAISACITVLSDMPTVACVAMGHPKLQLRFAAGQLIGNAVLSTVLLAFIGFKGILIGSVVAWSTSAIGITACFTRMGVIPLRRNPFAAAGVVTAIVIPTTLVCRWGSNIMLSHPLPALVLNVVLCIGVTSAATLCVGWLAADEIRFALLAVRKSLRPESRN